MRILIAALFISILFSCSHKEYKGPHILIETNYGDIEVELYPTQAPRSVAAFLSFIDSGIYKNSSFYRVLKKDDQPGSGSRSEIIQGGIWHTNHDKAVSLQGIPHESTKETGLNHLDGTISLARKELGTAGTEFFICVGDQPGFDYHVKNGEVKDGYAAFGRVVKGMDVVRSIHQQPDNETSFTPPIKITDIKRL
jgi:peptidyl-prolyl cis-trans isomerase A (cyclophilin A)